MPELHQLSLLIQTLPTNTKKRRRANAQVTCIQVKNRKIHTSHTEHIVLDLFNVCSNHTQFKPQWTRISFLIAVYDSDTTVTLKQNQGHQT